MYDRPTVQGATFNIRGQLYRGHANGAALSDDPGSTPGRCKALCP